MTGTYWTREIYGGNSAIDICSEAYLAGRFLGNWVSPSMGKCAERRLLSNFAKKYSGRGDVPATKEKP